MSVSDKKESDEKVSDQTLSEDELLRYSRQLLLPEFDVAGQLSLKQASVAIIGLGGLGCPAALYLANAGVGKLVLVDDDQVEVSNLQRQILHTEQTLGESKVSSAEQALKVRNSGIEIEALALRLSEAELHSLVSRVDLVLDCSDNFATRYMINRVCFDTKRPLVSGAAIRFDGQICVYDFRQEPKGCYACLYPQSDSRSDEQLTCSESGVISPLVGIVGAMQALEAIKVLSGVGQTLDRKLMVFDALRSEWRVLRFGADPTCDVCSE